MGVGMGVGGFEGVCEGDGGLGGEEGGAAFTGPDGDEEDSALSPAKGSSHKTQISIKDI